MAHLIVHRGLVGFLWQVVGGQSPGITESQRGIVVVLGWWSRLSCLNVLEKLPGSGLVIESWGCGGCSWQEALVVTTCIVCGRKWRCSDGLECL